MSDNKGAYIFFIHTLQIVLLWKKHASISYLAEKTRGASVTYRITFTEHKTSLI